MWKTRQDIKINFSINICLSYLAVQTKCNKRILFLGLIVPCYFIKYSLVSSCCMVSEMKCCYLSSTKTIYLYCTKHAIINVSLFLISKQQMNREEIFLVKVEIKHLKIHLRSKLFNDTVLKYIFLQLSKQTLCI